VYFKGEMVGIIDLALDISEYDGTPEAIRESSLRQMRAGIRNLLSVIEGSITNSLKIISTVDIFDFLSNYMSSSQNVLQIAILSADGRIEVSNDKKTVGSAIDTKSSGRIVRIDGQPAYPVIAPLGVNAGSDKQLYLLIDATPYVANERKLLFTAIGTSSLAIIFSLLITYSMYRFNIERTLHENMRLEHTVKERTSEIRLLSRTDPLTGLNNRRHLDEILDYEFRRAQRYDHGLALMVLDLDHFKKINDTYGHLGGDAVLRSLGILLRTHLRETDIAGRYGGEEFVIVLPETGLDAAKKVAEHLRALIEKMAVDFEGLLIPVTCSIGVGVLRPEHAELKALLHEADAALYRSKQAGRNRVTDFASIAENASRSAVINPPAS
jgi:diguanylate cyclase (GGDEF)-like protein